MAGPCMNPWPENPAATESPSTPVYSADKRIVVRRHLIEARPTVADGRIGEGRGAVDQRVNRLDEPLLINALVPGNRFVRIGHPEQESAAFRVEVK